MKMLTRIEPKTDPSGTSESNISSSLQVLFPLKF